MKKTKILLLQLLICLAVSISFGQTKIKQTVWKLNSLKRIGGNEIEVLGEPKIIETERGKAILFDGTDDGIIVKNNPLERANEFTIEAVFRPDADGAKEQRWLHIEDEQNAESRALLETRLVANEWFLDTFIKSGENRSALFAENFKHPTNEWHTVALVFDGKQMRHYVNGKLEMSGAITIKPFGKGKTALGVRMNRVYWFKGAIRKARFTNRALSPDKFLKSS